MDARICTNPKCRTILPYHTCSLCDTPTEPLPRISLGLIGIDGAARLIHTPDSGYSILITTSSGHHAVNVSTSDILHSAQAHLPHLNPTTGLMIMDSLKDAATLIRTKNTGHWSGWVLYLLDLLQDRTDTATFQAFLKDVQQDLTTNILKDLDPPEGA